MEVAKLLDKLPSEMIQLDPNAIGQLRDVPKRYKKNAAKPLCARKWKPK